jgi:hypothetical protein
MCSGSPYPAQVELLQLIAAEGFAILASAFGARLNVPLQPADFERFTTEVAAAGSHVTVLLFCQRAPST